MPALQVDDDRNGHPAQSEAPGEFFAQNPSCIPYFVAIQWPQRLEVAAGKCRHVCCSLD